MTADHVVQPRTFAGGWRCSVCQKTAARRRVKGGKRVWVHQAYPIGWVMAARVRRGDI